MAKSTTYIVFKVTYWRCSTDDPKTLRNEERVSFLYSTMFRILIYLKLQTLHFDNVADISIIEVHLYERLVLHYHCCMIVASRSLSQKLGVTINLSYDVMVN